MAVSDGLHLEEYLSSPSILILIVFTFLCLIGQPELSSILSTDQSEARGCRLVPLNSRIFARFFDYLNFDRVPVSPFDWVTDSGTPF